MLPCLSPRSTSIESSDMHSKKSDKVEACQTSLNDQRISADENQYLILSIERNYTRKSEHRRRADGEGKKGCGKKIGGKRKAKRVKKRFF
jgi:hypothetical protein